MSSDLINRRDAEAQRVEQFCTAKCACGKKVSAYLKHYDKVPCACGQIHWAIQPLRRGPFVLVRWPGDYQMFRYQELSRNQLSASASQR